MPARKSLSWDIVLSSSSFMMVFIPHHERNLARLQTHFILETPQASRLTSYWTRLFIDFLKALVQDSDKPVFLILDNHPVHHARRAREYVESLNGKLKLFFLPPYSPELNPDESVWGYIKYHHVGKKVINSKEHLRDIVLRQLRRLQKLPKLLKSFFGHPDLAYISG